MPPFRPFGISDEQSSIQFKNTCPVCSSFPIVPRYIKPDGSELSPFTFLFRMHRDTIAECTECKSQWFVFKNGSNQGISLRHPDRPKLITLREFIVRSFDLDEIRTVCFDLGIVYDSLEGNTIQSKTRELLIVCIRDQRLDELIDYIRSVRPNLPL